MPSRTAIVTILASHTEVEVVTSPRARRVARLTERHRGVGQHQHDEHRPAEPDRQVLGHDRQHGLALDPDRAALADDLEQQTLQGEERRQRDDEGRDADPGDQQADHQPDHGAGGEAARARRGTTACRAWWRRRRASAPATPAVKPADRSISPMQQDEHQAHRDDDDRGALDQQVGEVERVGERVRPQDGEDDEQHGQAEDGGQRADVAAADPRHVLAEGVAEAGWGAGGTSTGSSVTGVCVMTALPSDLASRRVHRDRVPGRCRAGRSPRPGRPPRPASPPVMSWTTSLCVTSLASTCAVSLPR